MRQGTHGVDQTQAGEHGHNAIVRPQCARVLATQGGPLAQTPEPSHKHRGTGSTFFTFLEHTGTTVLLLREQVEVLNAVDAWKRQDERGESTSIFFDVQERGGVNNAGIHCAGHVWRR